MRGCHCDCRAAGVLEQHICVLHWRLPPIIEGLQERFQVIHSTPPLTSYLAVCTAPNLLGDLLYLQSSEQPWPCLFLHLLLLLWKKLTLTALPRGTCFGKSVLKRGWLHCAGRFFRSLSPMALWRSMQTSPLSFTRAARCSSARQLPQPFFRATLPPGMTQPSWLSIPTSREPHYCPS